MYLRKYLSSTFLASLFAIIIFTQPPFWSLVSYDGLIHSVTAMLLSLCAGLLADKIPQEKSFWKQMLSSYFMAAVFLLFYAISIYPTAAMYYWVLVALVLLSLDTPSIGVTVKRIGKFFCVGFVALFIYAIVLICFKQGYSEFTKISYNPLYYPYAIEFNLLRKMKWFFQEPLFNSLNLWNIFPKVSYAAVVGGIILSAFFLRIFSVFRHAKQKNARNIMLRKFFFNLILFISLFFLSFLPNLVAKGDAPFYRCCLGITTMIVIALIWSLKEWTCMLPVQFRSKILTSILLFGCLWGVTRSYQTVLYYRALPSYIEKKYVKNILKKADMDKYKTIYIIRPDFSSLGLRKRYDEFGSLTTHYPGDKRAFLAAIFRELGVKNTKEYVERFEIVYVLSVEGWYTFEESALVIDMRKVFDDYPGYLSRVTIR